ncbi:MAG: glycine--tRNA ligase [Clostridium sp.]
MEKKLNIEQMAIFCKQYGYIYPGSDIYGGLANTWDYGPLGSRIKNNLKDAWRKRFIQEQMNSYEIDANILMHPRVWKASGHVASFYDPKMDCKKCKARIRVDKYIDKLSNGTVNGEALSYDEMEEYIKENNGKCPHCGGQDFTKVRKFSQMFETYRGTLEENKNIIYLRPENAQGEYVNYLNVLRSSRAKLPFSIGQIGKAFRNEVTPGNLTFRTIEFEQMEFQTFCKPGEDLKLYEFYKDYALKFFNDIGLPTEKLRFMDHAKLVFYAKAACDIEYLFPFGYGEINGTHDRTDYDLTQHQEYSGKSMEYLDEETKEKFIPYIVESTVGADRATLALLYEAYNEEELEDGTTRIVMKFNPKIAPYKLAVLPLLKNKHSEYAKKLYLELAKIVTVDYDESGSIGKRYRRQDINGTPYVVTVDDNTLKNNEVTIRDRDSMQQETIKISEIEEYILNKLK